MCTGIQCRKQTSKKRNGGYARPPPFSEHTHRDVYVHTYTCIYVWWLCFFFDGASSLLLGPHHLPPIPSATGCEASSLKYGGREGLKERCGWDTEQAQDDGGKGGGRAGRKRPKAARARDAYIEARCMRQAERRRQDSDVTLDVSFHRIRIIGHRRRPSHLMFNPLTKSPLALFGGHTSTYRCTCSPVTHPCSRRCSSPKPVREALSSNSRWEPRRSCACESASGLLLRMLP